VLSEEGDGGGKRSRNHRRPAKVSPPGLGERHSDIVQGERVLKNASPHTQQLLSPLPDKGEKPRTLLRSPCLELHTDGRGVDGNGSRRGTEGRTGMRFGGRRERGEFI